MRPQPVCAAGAIADGRVYFDIEFTPAYPAERITFTSRLTQDHLTTLVND